MARITEDMLVCDVLELALEMEAVLSDHGLPCYGCPGAANETLREAAEGHGVDLASLLEDLNRNVK